MRYFSAAVRRKIGMGAVLCSVAALSACGMTKTKQTFDLTAISVAFSSETGAMARRHKRFQILVPAPEAVKALDGQDIVVEGSPGSISYLKGAQWGDRLPNLVQARLISALEDSGRVSGVGRPGQGLAIDYQLITDIRTFGIEPRGRVTNAHVRIAAQLMNDRNGSVRAAEVFSAQVPVNGGSNRNYAQALDAAFAQVCGEIVNWTLLKN